MEETPIQTPPVKLKATELSLLRSIVEGSDPLARNRDETRKLHWLGLIEERVGISPRINYYKRELADGHMEAEKLLAKREYRKLDTLVSDLARLKEKTEPQEMYFPTLKGEAVLRASLAPLGIAIEKAKL